MCALARGADKSLDSQNRVELWERGTELDGAWFTSASEDEKRRYRASDTDQYSAYLRVQMQRELLTRLAEGTFQALGFREGDPPDAGPVPIPRYLFPISRLDAPEVQWDRSELVSAGHHYTRIRIAKPAGRVSQSADLPAIAVGRYNAETPTRKMGRPRVDDALRSVVRELVGEHRLSEISRKEQINFVRQRARQNFPKLFLRPEQPSRTKILEALRAEGL